MGNTAILGYVIAFGVPAAFLIWFLVWDYGHWKRMREMDKRPGESNYDWGVRLGEIGKRRREGR